MIIEKSRFQNANGPGDSAGVHIDYNCRNVIVQYNLSAHNAGGFCEILGNNYNCAYRYNVSVNDGYRVKGKASAFQEGKTFWLSGYVGKGNPAGPFNTYFYNKTIYVSTNIVAKIAVAPTAAGVLIANNIFCIEGRSQTVLGDQNRADKGVAKGLRNVVFENNLYQSIASWPANAAIKDRSPIIGNPAFVNAGGNKFGRLHSTKYRFDPKSRNPDFQAARRCGWFDGGTQSQARHSQPPDFGLAGFGSHRAAIGGGKHRAIAPPNVWFSNPAGHHATGLAADIAVKLQKPHGCAPRGAAGFGNF